MPGAPELLVILAIVFLVFGASRLPNLARSLGKAKNEFQEGMKEGAAEKPEPAAQPAAPPAPQPAAQPAAAPAPQPAAQPAAAPAPQPAAEATAQPAAQPAPQPVVEADTTSDPGQS